MMASVLSSSALRVWIAECLERRTEGKALGFDFEVTSLAEVSAIR